MKDRIAIIFLTLSFIIISTYFSWFLYKAFMFLFMCYFQLYYRDFIPMKIISFTFFFIFLNKTMFKDKTHMILVQGLCWNLKQIKNGKKRNWLQFSEKEKMICVVFTKKNWKKCLASLWPLHKGVATSRPLVCQTMIKIRCRCKLLTKVHISKAQKRGEHYHPTL